MGTLVFGLVSVLLTTGLGAVALLRSRFDPIGRLLLAFVVGQAILPVSAGALEALGVPFGVPSAVIAGLVVAAIAALAYRVDATEITAFRRASPALVVLACIWVVQTLAALRFGIHHYDFTFYHDILSRSLAHTGRLADPYLVSIGYGSWFLSDYGSSVVMDAFNAILIRDASRLAWYLNALLLPALVLLFVAQRAGATAALVTAVAFAFLFPLMLVDPRPHYTIAMLLAIANVAVLTSRPDSRAADTVVIAIVTVAAVLAKREAFVIFFFPCAVFFLLLLRDGAFWIALRFGALTGVPVLLTLVYRVTVPEHGGLSVGSSTGTSSTEVLLGTLGIVVERIVTNNGNLAFALALGLAGSAMQKTVRGRVLALTLFLSQILAFVFFVYATHQGGLNNYSTDYRKVAYPLIVAIAFFGIGLAAVVPRLVINHRGRLAIGLAAGVMAIFWHGDLYRYSEPYDQIRDRQRQWNALLDTLDLDKIDVLLLPGETFDTPTYMGGLARPHGLAAAIYPRQVRALTSIPPDSTGPVFLVSEGGPVAEISDLGGKVLETDWGLRYWTALPVPREATNGWSLDHSATDIEAKVSFSMEEDVVFVDSWGSSAAIAQAAPGQEVALTLINDDALHLTRLMLDAYPAARQDAPVHVEVYDAGGALLYASDVSDLPRFGSWIIPLNSASPKFTVMLRVGETGVMRFFRPRAMMPS